MDIELVRAVLRWIAILALVSLLGSVLGPALIDRFTEDDVEMPGRTVGTSEDPVSFDAFMEAAGRDRRHFVIQFRRDLTPHELQRFDSSLDLRLYGPFPRHAYIASAVGDAWESTRARLEAGKPAVTKVFRFAREDKLSDELRTQPLGLLATDKPFAMWGNRAQIFVHFFPDVSDNEQEQVLDAAFAIQNYDRDWAADKADLSVGPDPSGAWSILIDPLGIEKLVEDDKVQFIELTMPRIVLDMDIARADIGANNVDISDSNMLVAQWEGCVATTLHDDLADRFEPFEFPDFYCREWLFHDANFNGEYDITEPVYIDANEDGVVDEKVFDNADSSGASGWVGLELKYGEDVFGNYYLDTSPVQDGVVSTGDIVFEPVFIGPSTSPMAPRVVLSTDLHLGAKLRAYVPEGHPTMVAGVMIADDNSALPEGPFPGIATGASVKGYAWNHVLSQPVQYPNAMQSGALVANHSFGWWQDYYHFGRPEYPKLSNFFDSVSSGRASSGKSVATSGRILVVGSSGNEGKAANWGTARIINSAKNTISVGNVSSSDLMTAVGSRGLPAPDSGRGPTASGRLAPILSAPGSQLNCEISTTDIVCDENNDNGIRTTHPVDTYAKGSGTSFSTPIVAATAGLLGAEYQDICDAKPKPRDLRALLVHTAEDLTQAGNLPHLSIDDELTGPDFVFGYGMVRIDRAAPLVGSTVAYDIDRGWIEHRVMLDSYDQLEKNGDMWQLRVTLAWDDPPYYIGLPKREETGYLQNDLDLEVIDPKGWRHLPWVLDASAGNEGKPASKLSRRPLHYIPQEARDHANTVEQVLVDVPQELLGKTWTIRVRANKVYLGPQDYTLVSEAFTRLPWQDCGTFSNGNTILIPNPFDLPDTKLGWLLFWLAVIILVWLVLEAAILLYEALLSTSYSYFAPYAVLLLLLLLAAIFRLIHLSSFLVLAGLVLLWMLYALWRARDI